MSDYKNKQVIVWRGDLKVRKGKIAAQVAHASLKVILDMMHRDGATWTLNESKGSPVYEWLTGSFAKVVVKCQDEKDLHELYRKAKEAGLPCAMIIDAGHTEFNGVPTKTCFAIGPAKNEDIDVITGHLSLM